MCGDRLLPLMARHAERITRCPPKLSLSTMTDDCLRLARQMIEAVTVARDISAEEMTAVIGAPWLKDWPPLPNLDDL